MNDQYQTSPALQADLLDPNNSSNQIYLQAVPNGEQENGTNLSLDQIRNNLNYNIKFCLLALFIYCAKLAASAYVLVETDSCKDIKTTWVILMIVHDAVESLSILAMISVALKIRSSPSNVLAPGQQPHEPRTGQQQNLEQNPGQRPRFDTTALVLAREIRTRKRFIDGTTVLNKLYYFGVFIFGQVLLYFYFDKTDCGYNRTMWNLMLTYIILGYVWIFWPLLLAILLCFCLPCLPCIIYLLMLILGKPGQVAASKDVIKKLPVQKYNGDLPGEHECPICIAEYKEGDNIITLPCNNLHHFHEGCIKHWLEINGECPLCRQKITGAGERRDSNE